MLHIRNVKKEDLSELVVIENLCFLKDEAATEEAFQKRIQLIPDSFFVVEVDDVITGLINGPVIATKFISDDLFNNIQENPMFGGHQSILGLAVSPAFQNQGIASSLLTQLEKEAKAHKRESITLTCKDDLIHFYENHGFLNCGKSSSEHGNVTWYNMVKNLY